MPGELLQTFVMRPYVFAFLAAFLVLAILRWGIRKTLLWLISGYLIAWLSELSSIHNGFPYGTYKYVYENMSGELMFFGVPFFDSLSYVFLTFAGFTTASYLLSNKELADQKSLKTGIALIFLGAFLTMTLDVIIDPVATMGEKWFLGKIHYYVHPGRYFGVPLTNFAGWFLVAFAIIGFNVFAWHAFPRFFKQKSFKLKWSFVYPAFYISIALFQIVMAFIINATRLGMASVMILSLLVIAVLVRSKDSTVKQGEAR